MSFLKQVREGRYFSDRFVRTPERLGELRFATNGYEHNFDGDTNRSIYEVLCREAQMILPSEAEYERCRGIISSLPDELFPKLDMDFVGIGRF
jgi:hypothetical protein